MGFPAMTSFHQLGILAASRGEGLHPKLQALLARTAASPFSEVSMRHDGMIQAGPSSNAETANATNAKGPIALHGSRAVGAQGYPS
jgi:hypothetical protein